MLERSSTWTSFAVAACSQEAASNRAVERSVRSRTLRMARFEVLVASSRLLRRRVANHVSQQLADVFALLVLLSFQEIPADRLDRALIFL